MRNSNSIAKRNQQQDRGALVATELDEAYPDDVYYGAAQESSEKKQLFAVIATLAKHWFLILGITSLATGLVVVYEAQKPDYYTAEARIQVNNETNPAGGSAASSIVLSPGNDPAYFATQLQVIEGAGLLRRVVKAIDLENNPTFFRPAKGQEAGVWQNLLRMLGKPRPPVISEKTENQSLSGKQLELKIDSPIDLDKQAETLAPYVSNIQRSLAVGPVRDSRTASKETRLIEVQYTHFDPVIATKIVNAIADVYVLQNLEQKVESNASTSDFLRKRVAELQSQIREGEERLINYARGNQILSLDSTQNTVVQRLSDLNGRLSTAENSRIEAETAYQAALRNPLNAATVQSKDPRTTGLEQQVTELRQQLEQLKVEYTDEWPEVKKVQRQIAAIEKELAASKKRTTDTQLASLEQTYREALARERELRKNFDTQRETVLSQNEAAINYRIIQQEIDTNKTLLDNLLQRSRETEVILNGTPNNVRVLDRALVPNSPGGPQRTKNVIIAFVASLVGSIGIVFVLNWLDDTIRVSENLENSVGLPIIGLIPSASRPARRLIPQWIRSKKRKSVHKYQLEDFDRPKVSEAFHQLRTSLLLSTAGGPPKTVLVTSGQPFEGKTINALNLAKSLSQLGNSVLLIDADLRCPKLHTINSINNSCGLSTLLTSKELDQTLLDKAIHKGIETNLDLLPSGPQVPNPANLFGSVEMSSLLEQFDRLYSHIVIDSPPVLYFADSIILAANVEAVVLVARVDFSSGEVLAKAKKKMQDVCANVVGVILNDVPQSNFKYDDSAYYKQLEESDSDDSPNGSMLRLDQ